MPKGGKNIDINSDEQLLIMRYTIETNMQATFESNRQETDNKRTKLAEYLAMITSNIISMMDHTKK